MSSNGQAVTAARTQAEGCGTLTVREAFLPDLVTIVDCEMTPSDVSEGEDVQFRATIRNDNPVGARMTIRWDAGPVGLAIAEDVFVGAGATFEASMTEQPSPGAYNVEVTKENVRQGSPSGAAMLQSIQGRAATVDRTTLAMSGIGLASAIGLAALR